MPIVNTAARRKARALEEFVRQGQFQPVGSNRVFELDAEGVQARLRFRTVAVLAAFNSGKAGDSDESPLLNWNDSLGLFEYTFQGVGGRVLYQRGMAHRMTKDTRAILTGDPEHSLSHFFKTRAAGPNAASHVLVSQATARAMEHLSAGTKAICDGLTSAGVAFLTVSCNGLALETWEEVIDVSTCIRTINRVDPVADTEAMFNTCTTFLSGVESRIDHWLGLVKARQNLIAGPTHAALEKLGASDPSIKVLLEKYESLNRGLDKFAILITESLHAVGRRMIESLVLFQIAHDPFYPPMCVGGADDTFASSPYHDVDGVATLKLHVDFFRLVMTFEKTVEYYQHSLRSAGVDKNSFTSKWYREDFITATPSFTAAWTRSLGRRSRGTLPTISPTRKTAFLYASASSIGFAMSLENGNALGTSGAAQESRVYADATMEEIKRVGIEADGLMACPPPSFGNAYNAALLPNATDFMLRYACTRALAVVDMVRMDPKELTSKGTRITRACLSEFEILELSIGHNGLSLQEFSFVHRKILVEFTYRQFVYTIANTICRQAPGAGPVPRKGPVNSAAGFPDESASMLNHQRMTKMGSFIMGGWSLERRSLCYMCMLPMTYHMMDDKGLSIDDPSSDKPPPLPHRANPFRKSGLESPASDECLENSRKLIPLWQKYRAHRANQAASGSRLVVCLSPLHARFSGPRPLIEKLHGWCGQSISLLHECARLEQAYGKKEHLTRMIKDGLKGSAAPGAAAAPPPPPALGVRVHPLPPLSGEYDNDSDVDSDDDSDGGARDGGETQRGLEAEAATGIKALPGVRVGSHLPLHHVRSFHSNAAALFHGANSSNLSLTRRLLANLRDDTLFHGDQAKIMGVGSIPEARLDALVDQIHGKSTLLGEATVLMLNGLRLRWKCLQQAGVLGVTNAVCGMANRMALEYSALVNAQLHLYPESISLTNLLVIHTDMLRVTDALRELCTETVDPVVRSMIQDEVAGVLPSSHDVAQEGESFVNDLARDNKALQNLRANIIKNSKSKSGGMVQAFNSAALLRHLAMLSDQLGTLTERLQEILSVESTRLLYTWTAKEGGSAAAGLGTAHRMLLRARTFFQRGSRKEEREITDFCREAVAELVKPMVNLCAAEMLDRRTCLAFVPQVFRLLCDALVARARLDALRPGAIPAIVARNLRDDANYARALVEQGLAEAGLGGRPQEGVRWEGGSLNLPHQRALLVSAALSSVPFTNELPKECASLPDLAAWVAVRDFAHRTYDERRALEAHARLARLEGREWSMPDGPTQRMSRAALLWRWAMHVYGEWDKARRQRDEAARRQRDAMREANRNRNRKPKEKVPATAIDEMEAAAGMVGELAEAAAERIGETAFEAARAAGLANGEGFVARAERRKQGGGSGIEDPAVLMRRHILELVPECVNVNAWVG